MLEVILKSFIYDMGISMAFERISDNFTIVQEPEDEWVDIDDDELVEYIQYVQICRERDRELYDTIMEGEN